jgi:hypothetical protein
MTPTDGRGPVPANKCLSLKEAYAMRTSDTGLIIGQSYVGKARFWIKSRRIADAVVRLGLTDAVEKGLRNGLKIRMLIIGYCFGIRSERKLCEEVRLHLAYRWFCQLDLNDAVPHHSTFSENRLNRFRESDILRHM